MPSESLKPTQSHSSDGENKHKQLDREIREMVSAITNRVTDFHKSGSAHSNSENDDGVRIITLAGTNDGATLKGELDEKSSKISPDREEAESLKTYVNSNFQAINNSMMLGGSYHANDPGVHMDIEDFTDSTHLKAEKHEKKDKDKDKEKKKKKKEKEGSKSSEHHRSD